MTPLYSSPNMPLRTLFPLEILSQSVFEQFGSVVETPSDSNPHPLRKEAKAAPANQGTATRISDVSVISSSYPPAHPNQNDSSSDRPCLCLYMCTPRSLRAEPTVKGNSHYFVLDVPVLERHPYTTQTFVPLDFDDSKFVYIVIVAPTIPTKVTVPGERILPADNPPDWNRVRAFLATSTQGVTYAAGTWHSPMMVVRKDGLRAQLGDLASFVVTQWVNGVASDNVQEAYQDGVGIGIPSSEPRAASKL